MDDDRFELMQRRLTDAVEDRVQARLTRRYSLVVAGFLAGAALAGWKVYDDVLALAQKRADAAVEAVLDEVKRAETLGTEARVVIRSSQSTLADLAQEVRDASSSHQKVISQLKSSLAQLQVTAADLDGELKAQRERAETLYAGAGNLVDLASSVENLAKELRQVEERVAAATGRPATDIAAVSDSRDKIDQIVEQAAIQAAAPVGSETTVFFQFAVLEREAAEAIARSLRTRGFNVPGLERLDSAANLQEIRFFHDSDKTPAERLAAELGQALAGAGYSKPSVVVRNLTDFRFIKPRPGTVELWLGIRPTHD